MKSSLKPGITYQHQFVVSESKTAPALYPEATEFTTMPTVFATGFMIGFLEWACIKIINPHLDYPTEQSMGRHINVSHEAATPPGMIVTADVELIDVDGNLLYFTVEANDGVDIIAKGTHERCIVDRQTFINQISKKKSSYYDT